MTAAQAKSEGFSLGNRPWRLVLAQRLCRWLPPLLSMRLRSVVYPQSRAFADDCSFTVRAQTGSSFSGRTSDFHGYPFSVHGYYEWRNWAIAGSLCSEGDTIVEIGANVGTEMVGFRDIVGASGRVHAFEPVPSNIQCLNHLAALNRWNNVFIHPHALGDTEKPLTFVLPPSRHASGVGHLAFGQGTANQPTIEVRCRRLDSLADEIGSAKAIFCDAEGAEAAILSGARDYIGRHKPIIILEASPKLLVRAGSSIAQLHALLHSFDYTAFAIGRFDVASIAAPDSRKACNWFCTHNSMKEYARKCSVAISRCGLMPCVRGLNPLCK